MRQNISEVPKRPLPHVPPAPQEPHVPYVQAPTVVVYERERWEYKVVTQDRSDDPVAAEEALNAFGKDGWELIGVVPVPGGVQLYLKRARGSRDRSTR